MVFIKAFKLNFGEKKTNGLKIYILYLLREENQFQQKKYCFKKSFTNPDKVK